MQCKDDIISSAQRTAILDAPLTLDLSITLATLELNSVKIDSK